MRRAAKVDTNQPAIVQALRGMGCSVQSLATVGRGCPDLLVGAFGQNLLLEVKDGDKKPSARKLTSDEAEWHRHWAGQVAVVESPEQAISVIESLLAQRALRGQSRLVVQIRTQQQLKQEET